MCADNSKRSFSQFVSSELVAEILSADSGPELPELPPISTTPYALVQVANEPFESIRSRMVAVLMIADARTMHKDAILGSFVFLSFPGNTENLALREKLRDETIEKIMKELKSQCRVVAGGIRGHYGVLSNRQGWFGLLCPHIERLFEQLVRVPVGSAARFDLP